MYVKKLALFVEGQTEQIFLQRLIEEIAGSKRIKFEVQVIRKGGVLGIVKLSQKPGTISSSDHSHFVLIVDCMGDERVKSTLLDQRPSLLKNGYSLILGLRDLYPTPLSELAKVKSKLSYMVPTSGVPTQILLAVSEIEAWFLQEFTHFRKIHPKLDPSTFKNMFGFDPINDSAETVHSAAGLLDQIYSSVGFRYKKSRNHVERTVSVVDCAALYITLPASLPHLREFVQHIDNFLS